MAEASFKEMVTILARRVLVPLFAKSLNYCIPFYMAGFIALRQIV